jgi:hypothetical protein
MVEGDELAPHADWRKSMRLRATALTAVLMAAIFPSLTVQAEAWGVYHCGYCYGESGFGYEFYGCTPIYSYSWTYPAYREHRYASHRYVRRPAAIRGVRHARSSNSAAATPSSGLATTGSPSLSTPSVSSPSVSSPSTSTGQQPAANQLGSTATELQQAKVDATNAKVSESGTQRKLTDIEANLKQAKDEAAKATKEAGQARADAQSERQSTEAALKQAKDEAARAAKEAQQARADAQAARQSKAEAERKLAESEAARTATEAQKRSQTDPLGTWLRGFVVGADWVRY